MVDNGLGISILPELMLKNSMLKIIRKPLDVPAYRNIAIAFKDQKSLPAITQKFIDYAQLWVQEEYGV
jgi:DNA-binding transcriptional LysR family regulator